jgi:hypothetical protein
MMRGVMLLACLTGAGAAQARGPESLTEVAAATEVLAEVQLATPATTAVQFPVSPAGDKDCGTRPGEVWRVQVTQVIHPVKFSPIAAGAPLLIFPADTLANVGFSQDACAGNEVFNPMFAWYPGAEPRAGAKLLVLLKWEPGLGWREVVRGTWLAPSKLSAIKKALAANPKPKSPFSTAYDDLFAGAEKHQAMCVSDGDCAKGVLACATGPCGTCPGTIHPASFAAASVARFHARCSAYNEPKPPRKPRPGHPIPPRVPPNCSPCREPLPPLPPWKPVCKNMHCTGEST